MAKKRPARASSPPKAHKDQAAKSTAIVVSWTATAGRGTKLTISGPPQLVHASATGYSSPGH